MIISVNNTKLPCYTLPLTQHHSFFKNLPPLFICFYPCRVSYISKILVSEQSCQLFLKYIHLCWVSLPLLNGFLAHNRHPPLPSPPLHYHPFLCTISGLVNISKVKSVNSFYVPGLRGKCLVKFHNTMTPPELKPTPMIMIISVVR